MAALFDPQQNTARRAAENAPRVIALGGPTATGKTALAVRLAKTFGGEVLGADSMQIYRGLSVGTAKPAVGEMQGVAHHLIDFLPPEQAFSVADYTAAAARQIAELSARGVLPIVAGGTGLYITSLLDGVRFAPDRSDPALRGELQARAAAGQGAELYAELAALDPAYAATLHPNNLPRVIRALELARGAGQTVSEQRAAALPERPPYRALLLCLTCSSRDLLYARINARVDAMIAAGLLQEARLVYEHRAAYRTAAQAIGYKEYFPYFEGTAALDECTATLKQATRNYAKRQLTWFRRRPGVNWLYADDPAMPQAAEQLVRDFLSTAPQAE